MQADLRLFRYALAVADERSFTRAAARLGIAQPPLSQQIHRLERELGFSVFERARTGVTPTRAGTAFLAGARVAIASSEQAIRDGQSAARGVLGNLAIGLSGGSMFSFLPAVLREYRRERPEVKLDLRNLSADAQLALLAEGRLDVGFTRAVPAKAGLARTVIHVEPFVAALPAAHPLARRKTLDLAALAAEPFVLFPDEGSGFHAEVVALCRAAQFVPNTAQTIAPMHALLGLVSAGLGVSVVPASVRIVAFPDVRYVPLRGLTRAARQYLVHAPGRLAPVARDFVDFVRRTVAGPAT